MALASALVRATCVEANEFPHLSAQFRVRGVPHTVINRRSAFVGALPEPDFVAAVLEGAGVAVEPTPHPHPTPQGGREMYADPPPQGGREMYADHPPRGGSEIPRGPSTEISA